jgi:hypothetical protein
LLDQRRVVVRTLLTRRYRVPGHLLGRVRRQQVHHVGAGNVEPPRASAGATITGIRSCIAASSALAVVVTIVHV